MRQSIKAICAAGFVAAGLLMAGSAKADIIPTLNGGAPTGTGPYTWAYNASLSAAEDAVPNNFFTIYDIVGLQSGSEVTPANWVFSEQLLGLNADNTTPPDSGSVTNITFYYAGPASGPTTIHGDQASLGTFSFVSTDNLVGTGWFSATAINNSGPNIGTLVSNVGNVSVPVSAVPLPAALPFGLALLAGLGLKRKLAC